MLSVEILAYHDSDSILYLKIRTMFSNTVVLHSKPSINLEKLMFKSYIDLNYPKFMINLLVSTHSIVSFLQLDYSKSRLHADII